MVDFFGRPFLNACDAVALVSLAEEHRFDFWHVHNLTEAGLVDLRHALAAVATMGADLVRAYVLTALAATLGRMGEVQPAFLPPHQSASAGASDGHRYARRTGPTARM